MAKPLFYVDLSEGARDYRHTALEPGLPLLDRQGVNFQILRKWLGDYVGEPEWRNQDTIAFYVTEEERGRLEDVDCYPVTRGELEKNFAPDLEQIRNKIKKIRPESSTEEMVHRILKKTIAEQTNDLENSDFDSYFFKCRAGKEDWRLVWCCGYQRADLEPLRARLWNTPNGEFLGVRPPDGGKAKRRKRRGPLAILESPVAMLLLLLLIGGLTYAGWPTLKVNPQACSVPMGGRIEYKVTDHRWLLFKKDVTLRTLAESHDPRVIEFGHGAVAEAKSVGKTFVSFRVGNRFVDAEVDVTQPAPPDSLTIEPDKNVRIAVTSTKKLKAIGHYDNGVSVDLTTQVTWEEKGGDKSLLVFKSSEKGLIQGDSTGTTKVVAAYPVPRKDDTIAEASIDVDVVLAEFTSLAVKLQPEKFGVNQSSKVEVIGKDKDGKEYTLTGSSLLKLKVDPTNIAAIDGDYVVGKSEGAGQLKATYAGLDKSLAFNVSGRAGAKGLLVQPLEVADAVIHELVLLNVIAGNDQDIEAASSDPKIVEVLRTEKENPGNEVFLAARALGEATITVSNAGRTKDVRVVVTDGKIQALEFDPPAIGLRVGEPKTANLVGTTDSSRRIKVVTDRLSFEKQPRVENVYLDKTTLLLKPLEATTVPQDLQVRLEDADLKLNLVANATVEVTGGDLAMLDPDWGVHPPINRRRGVIDTGGYLPSGAIRYDANLGGIVVGNINDPFKPLGSLPKGAIITDINGYSLRGLDEAGLVAYFRDNPILEGDVIRYQGDDGTVRAHVLGGGKMGVVQDFKLLDVQPLNVAADRFNAELRVYLRMPGDYRLTDAAGQGLTEWAAIPADACPVMTSGAIARNPKDDYELYIERKIGDELKRFQVPFKLEPEMIQRAVVEKVEPVNVGRTVIESTVPAERRVRRTRRVIHHHGAGVGGTSDDAVAAAVGVAPGARTTRTVTRSGNAAGSGTGSGSGAPGSGSGAPGSGSAAPGSPDNAKPSPSPADPSPGSGSKAPPGKPSPAKPDGSPAPGKPAPGKPAPGKPGPGSGTAAPADADDDDANPAQGAPVAAQAQGSGSGTAGATGSGTAGGVGSGTHGGYDGHGGYDAYGRPIVGPRGVVGRVTAGSVSSKPPEGKYKVTKNYEDKDDPKKSKFLEALKKYNRRNDE
jgi:hypothetical protein